MTLQCCNHKVAPGPAKQPFAAPLDLLPEQVDLLGEQLDLLREQLKTSQIRNNRRHRVLRRR